MLPRWTQYDALVDGARLHYYRTGHGDKPPLVLVHGFSDNGLCWTPVARELEAQYDVVMPDMLGHGLSDRAVPGERPDMAADLAGLIEALGLRSAIVGGHSMGAMVAYQIGARFPGLASALILEDPPWWLSRPVPATRDGQPIENSMVTWAKSLQHRALEDLEAGYRADHPDWPDELILPMCESKKQLDPATAEIMIGRMHDPEANWLTTIRDITIPMLLLAGDPELGGIVTPALVAKVRELNPGVKIVNVPDAGHLIRFDRHEVFMEALRAFLNTLAT